MAEPMERRRRDDEQHEAILSKLNAIEMKLASTEHYFEQLSILYTAVKGNGKKGLEERTAILEERETKRDRREWLIQSVMIAQMIGLALMAVIQIAGK
jgi:hypothetical protein